MFGFGYQPPVISSIRLESLEVSAQAAADTAVAVKDTVQGLHDLTLQYRNDAEFFYTQVQQFQEGDYVTQLDFDNRLSAFRFDELTGIPETFYPTAHRHNYADLDNVPLTFAPQAHRHDYNELDNVPSEFEPAEHAHSWLQIEGKPGTFPPEMHYHDWPSITNKPSAYPAAPHAHSWPDITGKPSTYKPSAHGHTWPEISNKPSTYPPSEHSHSLDSLTGASSRPLHNAGYCKLPGGIIMQWMKVFMSSTTVIDNLPMVFPNGGLVAVASDNDDSGINSVGADVINPGQVRVKSQDAGSVHVIVIGY